MLTERGRALIGRAKDDAVSRNAGELDLDSLSAAIGAHPEARLLLAECLGLARKPLEDGAAQLPAPGTAPQPLPLARAVRSILHEARDLASQIPDLRQPGLIDLRHVVAAVALSQEACANWSRPRLSHDAAAARVEAWYERELNAPLLGELTERIRGLRDELLQKVFGQDHAVQAFVEGLFNAEVAKAADTSRVRPQGIFVFAGPPGVGKTYLATLGAETLERPVKRFDMSAFSGHGQHEQLVGMGQAYRGAHAGRLTEFVEQHPDAVLLFDEIEKASTRTIQLFLQVLDAGTLEDKYHEREIGFRDTLIIFTTNAGRKLYEGGSGGGQARLHRQTILSALQTEKNAETGEPYFPAAICSRMATGYPVLFNHLGVAELERLVQSELRRVGDLLERQMYKQVTWEESVPSCLVLREGVHADARALRSQTEAFVKTQVFHFCELFDEDRLQNVLEQIDRFHIAVEADAAALHNDIRPLIEAPEKPRVLLVAAPELAHLYQDHIGEVDWEMAFSPQEALEVLAAAEVDLVLLDVWLGGRAAEPSGTVMQFDRPPLGARGLAAGQELLRTLHERLPEIPLYLLFLQNSGEPPSVDEELLAACLQSGGVRGVVASRFVDPFAADWSAQRDGFVADLLRAARNLARQRMADEIGRRRQVLAFDAVPAVDAEQRQVVMRLRNLRLSRAIAAADAGEMLEDVQRPATRFEDVIGAEAAKEELRFFLDYLKNPRRFSALGLKPPKGVLLHGPPGTGKTMLARAMAGESDLAFLPASGSSFVTVWQGSGPQNVRDLFERARRYAPAIVFIDEIDAIGKSRSGGPGNRAEENTLNSLLTELDGFTSPAAMRPVFVLAATNFHVGEESDGASGRASPSLDPALVRRFDRTILVDLPDRAARKKYLDLRLATRTDCSVSPAAIELLAERSSGMSVANLEAVIETAVREAIRCGAPLTDARLEEALEMTRFGEARPRSEEERLRTARHEAGHTLLYWLSGWWASYVTIVSRGNHGGYMAPAGEDAERGGLTKGELEAKIRVLLAGRAAELLYYGEAGLTTGASNDLERTTSLAQQMVGRFGMDEEFGLLAAPELLQHQAALGSPLYEKVSRAAGRILQRQMEETGRLLEQYRNLLDKLVEALQEKERVTREELQEILPAPLIGPSGFTVGRGRARHSRKRWQS